MEGSYITPAEATELMVWLCSPPLLFGVAFQISFLWRRGLFNNLRWHRVPAMLLVTCIAVIVLSVPIWLLLPQALIPRSIEPSVWLLPPFFLPSILSTLVVAPLMLAWALRGQRRIGT
jgi:hypothetical protein